MTGELTYWEVPSEMSGSYSHAYWNDESIERDKDWWIESPLDIDRIVRTLRRTGMQEEFDIFRDKYGSVVKGDVLDIAAGVCWASAELSKISNVTAIDALDFSLHRIGPLAERVIEGLGGNASRIRRIYGSFYRIKNDKAYDLVFMSQAFHHADFPLQLLIEADRVLKPGGSIALLGEHLITRSWYLKRLAKYLLRNRRLPKRGFFDLFPPDNIAGDHYYQIEHYHLLFSALGYDVSHVPTPRRRSMVLVAQKSRP